MEVYFASGIEARRLLCKDFQSDRKIDFDDLDSSNPDKGMAPATRGDFRDPVRGDFAEAFGVRGAGDLERFVAAFGAGLRGGDREAVEFLPIFLPIKHF